ncbi:MAG: hypothetical protein DRQ89_12665 [Epsilonproteobacteria bacterium]|nr:MAG: hypothetical protein DRQ89_12665 [Campylobacterota bacterium]
MMKTITFLIFLNLYVLSAWANVDAYNYNFSLNQLRPLLPGNQLAEDVQILRQENGYTLGLTYIKQLRYKFAVILQAQDGQIVDMFARLPSYFLHDIFHQSLINRFGKQDDYIKKENSALYIWNDKNGLEHSYNGSCTITCYPDFYYVKKRNYPEDLTPLMETLNGVLDV